MRYVQNTDDDRRDMLAAIGVGSIDELFRAVPAECREAAAEFPFPERLSDLELEAHIEGLAARQVPLSARPSFLGGGLYRHYVPAVVDAISSRGEFLTAYTPYQPEASQGSLQAFFEFQSMICALTGLDVANSSLYDGATALAEALLMARAAAGADARHKIFLSQGIHPEYRETVRTYFANLPFAIEEIPLAGDGRTPADEVRKRASEAVAVAFSSPTFFGTIEDARALARAAREAGAVTVQVFDPISLALLAPPGETGVDIACGEGQSLGSPPSFGGPLLGLLAARQSYLRQTPGRLVGRTKDLSGRTGYVLTLQTREQHIRRERATSNICTNSGLMALRATVYLAALGKEGLRDVARLTLERSRYAADEIAKLPGYALVYPRTPFFREFAVRCPRAASEVNRALARRGITGGLDLGRFDPEAADVMLFAVTEVNSPGEIDALAASLREIA